MNRASFTARAARTGGRTRAEAAQQYRAAAAGPMSGGGGPSERACERSVVAAGAARTTPPPEDPPHRARRQRKAVDPAPEPRRDPRLAPPDGDGEGADDPHGVVATMPSPATAPPTTVPPTAARGTRCARYENVSEARSVESEANRALSTARVARTGGRTRVEAGPQYRPAGAGPLSGGGGPSERACERSVDAAGAARSTPPPEDPPHRARRQREAANPTP